jgi:hypothetical protein
VQIEENGRGKGEMERHLRYLDHVYIRYIVYTTLFSLCKQSAGYKAPVDFVIDSMWAACASWCSVVENYVCRLILLVVVSMSGSQQWYCLHKCDRTLWSSTVRRYCHANLHCHTALDDHC